MPALDNAVSEILSDVTPSNVNRRLMQATLLDTHGNNRPAIEQVQMKTLANQAGVAKNITAAGLANPAEPQSPPGTTTPPGRGRA